MTSEGILSKNGHYIPFSSEGEKCICGLPATHKVEEMLDSINRHPLTRYLCCKCFGQLMGNFAQKMCKEQ